MPGQCGLPLTNPQKGLIRDFVIRDFVPDENIVNDSEKFCI
jgi:hypothetical protein